MRIFDFMRNINTLYKPAINQQQEAFYFDFLKRFSEPQLEELWTFIMQGHCRTSPPTIGEIKKYSNDVTPLKVISNGEDRLTEEYILSTELGRLALTQGWASSYLVDCQRDGVPEQVDSIVYKYQKALSDANNLAARLSDKDVYDLTLIGLRKSMREKELRISEKYKYLV